MTINKDVVLGSAIGTIGGFLALKGIVWIGGKAAGLLPKSKASAPATTVNKPTAV